MLKRLFKSTLNLKALVIALCFVFLGFSSNVFAAVSDGTFDSTFSVGTGFNGAVYDAEFDASGKIVVTGEFTSYNGQAVNRIARLNSNGTLDTSFNIGTGFNGRGFEISIASDGDIYVGGDFGSYNGNTSNYIARLNSDGSFDSGFTSGFGVVSGNSVRSISIQSDSKVVIGGFFYDYGATTAINHIARLNSNGTIDSVFRTNAGTGFNSWVFDITIQPDGKILIGGWFTQLNGTSRQYLVRLNTNGTVDTSLSSTLNTVVRNIDILSSGKLLVGGEFTNKLVLLNTNGTVDTSLNVGAGFESTVYDTAVSGSNFIVTGAYTTYKGLSAPRLIQVDATGGKVTTFDVGTGLNGAGWKILMQGDQPIIVGTFTGYDGNTANRIVRLTADSDSDGLSDTEEAVLGTNPTVADSDGDGTNDGAEVTAGGGSVASPTDTDGDGTIDALESSTTDTDGDGTPDQTDADNTTATTTSTNTNNSNPSQNKDLASTGSNLNTALILGALSLIAAFGFKKVRA